jgi:hypothetical protein
VSSRLLIGTLSPPTTLEHTRMPHSAHIFAFVEALPDAGAGYPMAQEIVNGDDVLEVRDAVRRAAKRARSESLPILVEAKTYRFRGHSMSDPAKYRTKDEVEEWMKRDPIRILAERIFELRIANEAQLKAIDEEAKQEVAEALWKGTPVIDGNVGGIRYQIEKGVNGFLVSSIEEAAARIVQLIKDKGLRERLGQKGRETVRERFLLTRLLAQYLDLFNSFETRFRLHFALGLGTERRVGAAGKGFGIDAGPIRGAGTGRG